ncbi:MAG: sugar phosphate isomerase/epimerase [candidate division NC10 bacterium]|nr:sugar phosphate isomerase/epimerase [candidate division NC10 bacterium]
MRESLQSYMQVGIVHFMAYPECLKGEGPIYDTLTKIVEDDFFSAVEITWIKDPAERQRVKTLLASSHMSVGFGAQPALLTQKLNLNSFDPGDRKRAVDQVKACADEAAEVGAGAIAVLSGPDPGERRDEAMKLLIDSLRDLAGYARGKSLRLVLESFDAKYDKKCLIGPHKDALAVCKALRKDFPEFGIMVDLSHLPIQEESPKKALGTLKKPNIAHIHIGNCVKRQGHPLYGDQHPRFGIPGGENDVPQVAEFLKELFEIGYLARGRRPVVAFEVKPAAGETSGAIIANAKRALVEAWARL